MGIGVQCTKLTAIMVSSYHLIPVICGAVSGNGIGQIGRLVNVHFWPQADDLGDRKG